jgi:hypothetical protein
MGENTMNTNNITMPEQDQTRNDERCSRPLHKLATKSLSSIDLGELPVDLINAVLGTELQPGRVRLTSSARRKMRWRHRSDYEICLAALKPAIITPSYIGEPPNHPGKFEIVKRLSRTAEKALLVAITLNPDTRGDYRVCSSYCISVTEVERRRQQGRLRIPGREKRPKAWRLPGFQVARAGMQPPDLLAHLSGEALGELVT